MKQLDVRFRKAKTPKQNLYYSKIAILELCGWIELSQDDLLRRVTRKKLSSQKNLEAFEVDVIKKNSGFGYPHHFRKMLIHAVGLINVEKIELNVDQQKKAAFEAELNTLWITRNSLAHTYIKGTASAIDAPSMTIARFAKVYNGIKEFESVIFKTI
ncbi:hypothetical protein [Parvibaculum sp.]|uniref:hypothetical protein n=1 Tax=Parvibaculum sp. TaxID=2024848 RepID=UPI00272FE587|nr:hypothetical protein [Parvibaculum sp.]MDP2151711.1 hypothetical protein [Parvibaculum sp.]MDP3328273.1 hypothetical protein [Parvibaculum sp.]